MNAFAHIAFVPVSEIKDPLNLAIGLSGDSGTGKTYTANLIARGIAEVAAGKGAPFGYVDTENRRALHYRAAFPEMMHFDFTAIDKNGDLVGFTPERWIEVIDAADEADLPALVIDSFSHSWDGIGGMLDMQADELDRLVSEAEARANGRYTIDPSRYSEKAWIRPKARYRRLVDRIVRAKTDIIVCHRAKAVRQETKGGQSKNARATKLRRADVPWDIAGDKAMIFEMTTSVILDPSAPGCPVHQIKVADQFKNLLDPRRPMDADTGRAMAEWARGQGEAQKQKEILDQARDYARNGTSAFTKWWQSEEGRECRPIVKTIIDELKSLASKADVTLADEDNDDPFGGEIADAPSPEELAAAEAAAKAEADRQAAEAN